MAKLTSKKRKTHGWVSSCSTCFYVKLKASNRLRLQIPITNQIFSEISSMKTYLFN